LRPTLFDRPTEPTAQRDVIRLRPQGLERCRFAVPQGDQPAVTTIAVDVLAPLRR
jgi:hypothetical protein